MRKFASLIIVFIALAVAMPILAVSVDGIRVALGLKTTVVEVVGTGSMYPSLFWVKSEGGPDDPEQRAVEEYRTTPHMYRYFEGVEILGNRYLQTKIGYGDMIAFKSASTKELIEKENQESASSSATTSLMLSSSDAGFIKRVIGLPGDKIELRDGFVIRNGDKQSEPYIYRPRSTYGDTYLVDCRVLEIPDNNYFVLGDNRKASSDSRGELGLVNIEDISFVLPYDKQQIYHSLWRDTSRDHELEGKPTLDVEEFYRAVNTVRKDGGASTLKSSTALKNSSSIKAKEYLAGNKDYPMSKALSRAGYQNVVTGEFVTPGNFTAEELLKNLLYFPSTAKSILNKDYDEIGVSVVAESIAGCPTQVIVGHLGGYLPAEYSAETISSWRQVRDSLSSVLPSWQRARGVDGVDQGKLESLISILERRLALARDVVAIMENKQWFSQELEARLSRDESDAKLSESLAKELNGE